MFVQVVSYSLEGISEDAYLDVANGLAPRYAGIPGLLAKIWLENPGGNRYGAVYFWEDAESMERFAGTDLFEGRTPEFADLRIEEFRALENLTAVTQPGLEILQPRRIGTAKAASATASAAAPDALEAAPAPPAPRQTVTKKRTPPPAKKAPATASKRSTKRSSGATA